MKKNGALLESSLLAIKIYIYIYIFTENNLVWPIKAQLISKSACSQVSHPVAQSLGNITSAQTIYTKAISFPLACQGDALTEPKI